MKVAIFGSTGFVGSYIVNKLLSQDFIPRVLIRKGSESKITSGSEVIYGDIQDRNSILETMEGTEAVVYNIGIIRQFPHKNLTFKDLWHKYIRRPNLKIYFLNFFSSLVFFVSLYQCVLSLSRPNNHYK